MSNPALSVTNEPIANLSDDACWNAVLNRDVDQDGKFVYGVASTHIYCRPSCPSRRPAEHRVRFFSSPDQAESAGYRACRRCEPRSDQRSSERRVLRARAYLDDHSDQTVTLEHLGKVVDMSPYHLQRTFKRVVGMTPKAYANARRLDRMKSELRKGHTVSRATFEAGYGSGSRAYEQANMRLGMTPGAYRNGGRGVHVRYTIIPTAAGHLLAAATERGLCAVMLGDEMTRLEASLRSEYPAAQIERDDEKLRDLTQHVVAGLGSPAKEADLPMDVSGSAFQRQVWEALRRIPVGETRSYRAVAQQLGRPSAARAVARACASNRLALVIPCHRVVREDGELGGYRWGIERKRRLLELERIARDGDAAAAVTPS
jgi:AraC family transcriptional regulator of adaptative response/methylated-DNA-[protein]-cysteine methyltransferase